MKLFENKITVRARLGFSDSDYDDNENAFGGIANMMVVMLDELAEEVRNRLQGLGIQADIEID